MKLKIMNSRSTTDLLVLQVTFSVTSITIKEPTSLGKDEYTYIVLIDVYNAMDILHH